MLTTHYREINSGNPLKYEYKHACDDAIQSKFYLEHTITVIDRFHLGNETGIDL